MDTAHTPCLQELRAAIAMDLTTLALLHHAELNDATLSELRLAGFPEDLGLRLVGQAGREAVALMREAVAALPTPMSQELLDELAADYAAIYLTYAYRASPCESVWLDQENLGMQAPMFQVREIYRRYQLAAPNWRTRPDDHLVLELDFLAYLMREEHPLALAEAARFLDEHLLRWLPRFAERVSRRCATAFYAGAARLTAAYCEELRELLAGLLGAPRPSPEEVEARMAPRPAVPAQPLAYVPGVAPSW